VRDQKVWKTVRVNEANHAWLHALATFRMQSVADLVDDIVTAFHVEHEDEIRLPGEVSAPLAGTPGRLAPGVTPGRRAK